MEMEVENINAKESCNRRAYWFMVSPLEKELIVKIRNNEIKLPSNKKPAELKNK